MKSYLRLSEVHFHPLRLAQVDPLLLELFSQAVFLLPDLISCDCVVPHFLFFGLLKPLLPISRGFLPFASRLC